jgi:hypothetical protein
LKTLIEIDNMFFTIVVVTTNSFHMFNGNELAKVVSQLVDLGVRVLDVFTNMRTT